MFKKKDYLLGEELLKRRFVTLEHIDHALDVQRRLDARGPAPADPLSRFSS